MPLIAYAAIALGVVPLLTLAVLHEREARRWWIAAAFSVSFLADLGALAGAPTMAGNLYPLGQAGLIGLALLDRRAALNLAGLLALVAVVSVGWRGVETDDVLLNTVGMLVIAGLAFRVTGLLRLALLSFGVGAVAWWAVVADPGWPSWLAYQGTRLAGTVLFCFAAAPYPAPTGGEVDWRDGRPVA